MSTFENMFLTPTNRANVSFTVGNDYTHAIILNSATPKLRPDIPKENVIGLAYEPPYFLGINTEFVDYAKKYIGKYYIGNAYDLDAPFVEGYGYMWYCKLPPISELSSLNSRPRIMSIMISKKRAAPGHLYRHTLAQRILQSNLPIDIYGNGCDYYDMTDSRLKGQFKESAEMFSNYQFAIVIENFETEWYMSEKLLDALVHGTVPIYLGAKQVDKKFPGVTIRMEGNIDRDFELIRAIISTPDLYYRHINQTSVRKEINLVDNIDTVFNAHPSPTPVVLSSTPIPKIGMLFR